MQNLTDNTLKKITTSDGIKIYYEVSKKHRHAKTILFLHGLSSNLGVWYKVRLFFDRLGYSTIALDLRGHGLSEHPKNEKSYSLNRYAKDILEIIEFEKINNIALIGHCFGGTIALVTESLQPNAIKNLVLIETSYVPPPFSKFISKHKLLKKFLDWFSEYAPEYNIPGHVDYSKFINTKDWDKKRIFNDLLHTSLKTYFLSAKQLFSHKITPLLKNIKVPTLIIEGIEDTIFPIDTVLKLHKKISKSDFELIENANHVIVLNNPLALEKTIHRFFKSTNF